MYLGEFGDIKIPFASYADAKAHLDNYDFDCLVDVGGSIGTTCTADFTSGVLNVDAIGTDIGGDTRPSAFWKASISAKAGSYVRVDFSSIVTTGGSSGTGTQIAGLMIDCAGAFFDPDSSGGLFMQWDITVDGTYEFRIQAQGYQGGTSVEAISALSSDDVIVPNPPVAVWDDGGTLRQLEACPKLYLPILTESTGNWYADCAAADVVLDSSQVSNCVGYLEGGSSLLTSFTASDGGTSLTLNGGYSGSTGPTLFTAWGSVNAEGGQTLEFTSTGGLVDVEIYDYTGTLVEASGTVTAPWASSALPATGRYTIKVSPVSIAGTSSLTSIITSSGAMTVNPIQALYATDPLLSCPARLNCGDTCP